MNTADKQTKETVTKVSLKTNMAVKAFSRRSAKGQEALCFARTEGKGKEALCLAHCAYR